jgi:hypothetical protein
MRSKQTMLALVVAAILVSALPALAAPAPANSHPAATPALATPSCAVAPAFLGDVAAARPATTTAPDWLDASHRFHGFCPCGCSPVPNCNTSADCGGAPCRPTISCC